MSILLTTITPEDAAVKSTRGMTARSTARTFMLLGVLFHALWVCVHSAAGTERSYLSAPNRHPVGRGL